MLRDRGREKLNFQNISAFVPFKDDKLESDMLKDVAHADVAKNDDVIDDPNYDDYYDVRFFKDAIMSVL